MNDLFGPPDARSPRDCSLLRTRRRRWAGQLVAAWHSTQPTPPAGERVAFVAIAPNQAPVAVALWGRPTARAEDQEHTLQLTRLACGPEAPRNLASWMLGQMRAWIRANMPGVRRLITYHDATTHHTGGIYAADNWHVVPAPERKLSHSWANRPGRAGRAARQLVKWERTP